MTRKGFVIIGLVLIFVLGLGTYLSGLLDNINFQGINLIGKMPEDLETRKNNINETTKELDLKYSEVEKETNPSLEEVVNLRTYLQQLEYDEITYTKEANQRGYKKNNDESIKLINSDIVSLEKLEIVLERNKLISQDNNFGSFDYTTDHMNQLKSELQGYKQIEDEMNDVDSRCQKYGLETSQINNLRVAVKLTMKGLSGQIEGLGEIQRQQSH